MKLSQITTTEPDGTRTRRDTYDAALGPGDEILRNATFLSLFTHISHFLGLTAVKCGWIPLHQVIAVSFPKVHFSPANLANERRRESHGILH